MKGGKMSSKIVGWLAYFKLLNGFEKYVIMSVEEILEHAQKYSKSWSRRDKGFYPGSAWDTSFDKMCEKTVLKLLIKGYGVLSDKMLTAIANENETGEIVVNAEEIEQAVLIEGETTSTTPARTMAENLSQLGFSPEPEGLQGV